VLNEIARAFSEWNAYEKIRDELRLMLFLRCSKVNACYFVGVVHFFAGHSRPFVAYSLLLSPPPGDGESAILTFGTCANDHEHRDRQYRWRCTQLIVRKSPGQWRLLAQDCARRLLNSLHFSMIDCNIVSIVTLRKHFTGFCSPRGICTRRM
jgi:hypothetical protein